MAQENVLDAAEPVDVNHRTRGHIPHQQDRQHDLISRQPENKGHDDKAVHAKQLGKRVKEGSHVVKHTVSADHYITEYPGNDPGRSGDDDSAG
ncbi:hypothetical protein D3C75_622040 [compost metagenome]